MATLLSGDVRLSHSQYWNADIAPTRLADRTWGVKDMAALWISMSACIPTYMLASSLVSEGMNWYQAILTILLGNAIVLIAMLLNAHAGTKFGIPFPVYRRASFGVRGANIPALLRALVAGGWFGIQAWIGSWAIYQIVTIYVPWWDSLPASVAGINLAQFACFLFFWGINMLVIYRGIETIRLLLGIGPNVPGFLGTIKFVGPHTVGPLLMHLYDYAWFVGFAISFAAYWIFMSFSRKPKRRAAS